MQAMRVRRFRSEDDRPAVGTARAVVSLNIQAKDTDVIGRVETKQNNFRQGYIKVTRK